MNTPDPRAEIAEVSRYDGKPRYRKPDGWEPDDPDRCQAWARTTGAQCSQRPMKGQRVCKKHGGKSPQAQRVAKRRLHEIDVADQVGKMLAAYDGDAIDPTEALLEVVTRTWAWVQVLGGLTGRLGPGHQPDGTDAAGISGIYGPDHLGDARPHVLMAMYRDWMVDLAKVSKLALDAGIAERQVRAAERLGATIANVLRAVAGELGLDLEEPDVAEAVSRHLRAIDGGTAA